MARREHVVTKIENLSKLILPEGLRQYVVIAMKLSRTSLLSEVAARFRIDRGRGYQGIDVFCFLVAYFCAVETWSSLRQFGRKTARWGASLAGVVGRAAWPSQASISRALKALTFESVTPFCDWLLQESIDDKDLSLHESVLTRDCLGQAWHVFHIDARVTALRQRALPEDQGPIEEEDQPSRRSDDFAAPGYPGRKRGEVQISRTMLQHAGSALWLMARVAPANGELEKDLHDGLNTIERWARGRNLDPARCLLCIDGVSGGYVQLRVCSQYEVRFVTRLACYEILKSEEVQEALNQRCWERVEDSGSGPARWASELGDYRFADETTARLVVTRFVPKGGKKSGAGCLIDGVQYEVFATNLDSSAWPAPEVVTEYYGRIAQENRYGQSDRELKISRVFSYNLAGQLLVETVGLWLWNFQTCTNVEMLGQLGNWERPQRERASASMSPSAALSLCPASGAQTCESADPASIQNDEAVEASIQNDEAVEASIQNDEAMEASIQNDEAVEASILALIEERLAALGDWTWDRELARPICPNEISLGLHRLEALDRARTRLIFRNLKPLCRTCLLRTACTSSTSTTFQKEITITLPFDATALTKVLTRQAAFSVKTGRLNHGLTPAPIAPPQHKDLKQRQAPLLVPSVLRQNFRDACRTTLPAIEIHRAPPTLRQPEYFALTPAERQHRRKTWPQRLAWNALEPDATIKVSIAVFEPIERLLT